MMLARTVRWGVACALLVLPSCTRHHHHHPVVGTPPTTATPAAPPPAHFVVRIDAVKVKPVRPTGTPWDDPKQPFKKSDGGCEFFAAAAGLGVGLAYGPGAGAVASKGASFLCVDNTPPAQVQQDPTAPDLQLLMSAGIEPAFATDPVEDVTSHVFRYPVVVPLDAVPPDGLKVEVIDVDGPSTHETIGMVRLSRDQLIQTYRSPTRMVVLASDSIERIEFVIDAYTPQPAGVIAMGAKEGTKSAGTTIMAGEVVSIVAEGSYHVSDSIFGANAVLGPAGYPGGGPKNYNWGIEPLRTAPHGCGFMAVGARRRTAALVAPATRFFSPSTGPMIVGVNDDDPGNNSGNLTFSFTRQAPTADEWRSRRAF